MDAAVNSPRYVSLPPLNPPPLDIGYCGSCKWCERLREGGIGFCRRYAPRAFLNGSTGDHTRAFAAFPIVRTSNDWCGEHVAINIPRI